MGMKISPLPMSEGLLGDAYKRQYRERSIAFIEHLLYVSATALLCVTLQERQEP